MHAGEGEEASTDGRTVFLSAGGDVARHRGELAVHAALAGGGSLAPGPMRRLLGRPAAARRYLLLEGHRTLAGLRHDLPGLTAVALAGVEPIATPSTGPDESLARALGREPLADPPAHWGTLRPRRVLAAPDHDPGSAPSPADLRKGARPAPVSDLEEDEETRDPGKIAELFSNPIGARGPVARLLHKLLGLGREEGTGPAGAELPTGSARATNRVGPHAVVSPVPLRIEPVAVEREPGTARYPEWDERRAPLQAAVVHGRRGRPGTRGAARAAARARRPPAARPGAARHRPRTGSPRAPGRRPRPRRAGRARGRPAGERAGERGHDRDRHRAARLRRPPAAPARPRGAGAARRVGIGGGARRRRDARARAPAVRRGRARRRALGARRPCRRVRLPLARPRRRSG